MRFNITARVLHWLSALVILWATVSGLALAFFEFEPDSKNQILDFNVSVTFTFIPFFLWRILNRVKHGVPSYSDLLSVFEIKLAKYMHKLLYVLVSVILLSGFLMMDKDFEIFKLGYFPHIINDKEVLAMCSLMHKYTSYILTSCIILHVLAVVKHEYNGIRILRRIL